LSLPPEIVCDCGTAQPDHESESMNIPAPAAGDRLRLRIARIMNKF
jgi:hypothetical protein